MSHIVKMFDQYNGRFRTQMKQVPPSARPFFILCIYFCGKLLNHLIIGGGVFTTADFVESNSPSPKIYH